MEKLSEVEKVVLVGTVIDLKPAIGKQRHQKWLVTFTINEVIEGDFAGEVFSCGIHSPIKSNLILDGKYVISLDCIRSGKYTLKHIQPCKNQNKWD